ncbi:MAG: hypothetical protein KJO35_08145 [Gammaproteobacteria bacterium]|nr:hypothetical protein [Gammaproteobacteria bacterium]
MIRILILFFGLAAGSAFAGKMTLLEEAAEFEKLSISVTQQGDGQFQLRSCDDCADKQLWVSADTVLTVRGKRLPVKALNRLTLRNGTVFFRVESGQVTRINASR